MAEREMLTQAGASFKEGSGEIAPVDALFCFLFEGIKWGLLIGFLFNKGSLFGRYCYNVLRVATPTPTKLDFTFHVLIHLRFVLGLVKCIHSLNRNIFYPKMLLIGSSSL